jgi:hypothetical protein
MEAAEADRTTMPPDAVKEATKRRLADAIVSVDPELEAFPFRYAEIAESEGISEAEARLRYRHIELNGPEDGPGIQITIEDDTATVTIPYWHVEIAARLAFQKIWVYLRVLSDAGSFSVFDPQLGRALDLTKDWEVVLDWYERVVRQTQSVRSEPPVRKRPLWRLW